MELRKERKYEFRQRLETVHKRNRRNPGLTPQANELEIASGWSIVIGRDAGETARTAARDLQDYFLTSMNVSVLLVEAADAKEAAEAAQSGRRVIVLAEQAHLPEAFGGLTVPRSYRLTADDERIVISGYDERGIGQGCFYLEDLLNLREAPFLERQNVVRTPLFSPRMVHSGYGLDDYPDEHLNAMAHAGFDAILVFVKGIDHTPAGYLDFNRLIRRAGRYGLDVYAYSYIPSRVHPEAPEAEEYYESTYGALFKACPGFKGIVFVGESCEFPSKDENTTGMLRLDWPEDKPRTKVSPGWWPCWDYPQWLNRIKGVIRKYNPQADIVFWTYNWGWAPEEPRLKLIRSLPDDISLQVTFEMFEQRKREGVTHVCVDYTVSFEGPGQYFKGEAQAAKERGITLYTMCNTGGLTWDIGVIPYEPVPYQWARRHDALLEAREKWGLSGLMESHHFGWWPSFVSDLAKWAYWSPSPPREEVFRAVARRDFSEAAAPYVLEAWRHFSDGIRHYIPTNEDQYGPFRIGPAYPFLFRANVKIPAAWHAMFGNRIINAMYAPSEGHRQSLGASRIDVEIRSLQRMEELWLQGIRALEKALELTPEHKREEGLYQLNLNRFIVHCVRTTIHVKQWYQLKLKLFAEADPRKAGAILDELTALANREIANAEAAIPLVEADSRLGWEPSMDYMADAEHIRWKIEHLRSVLDSEFNSYRQSLALTDPLRSS